MRRSILLAALLVLGCASPTYNYTPVSGERELLVLRADVCLGPTNCTYRVRAGSYEKQGDDEDSEYFWPDRIGGGGVTAAPFVDAPKALRAKKDRSELCLVTEFNVETCKPWPPAAERRTERTNTATAP